MALIGMDAQAVRALAMQIDVQARVLSGILSAVDQLNGQLQSVWSGHDADEFHGWWMSQHRPALVAVESAIAGLATSARNNAHIQDLASGGSDVVDTVGSSGAGSVTNGLTASAVGLGAAGVAMIGRVGDGLSDFSTVRDAVDLTDGQTLQDFTTWANKSGIDSGLRGLVSDYDGVPRGGVDGVSAALGVGIVASDVVTKGWGNGQTITDAVTNGGGLAATYVAGPAGGVAFQAGTIIGTDTEHTLESHFQIEEHLLDSVYGDPANMSWAQTQAMNRSVSNPVSFTGAVIEAGWRAI